MAPYYFCSTIVGSLQSSFFMLAIFFHLFRSIYKTSACFAIVVGEQMGASPPDANPKRTDAMSPKTNGDDASSSSHQDLEKGGAAVDKSSGGSDDPEVLPQLTKVNDASLYGDEEKLSAEDAAGAERENRTVGDGLAAAVEAADAAVDGFAGKLKSWGDLSGIDEDTRKKLFKEENVRVGLNQRQ